MALLQDFIEFIEKYALFTRKDRLLIAVSGGVDSMVLTALCQQAGYDFSIAHCHFGLRAEESDADATFVKSVAEEYGVPFYITHFDTAAYASQHKISIQVAARNLRYRWFQERLDEMQSEMKTPNKSFLLTAHHADDNMETVLMNFFKGTGIRGLTGIQPRLHRIIRPLLFAKKMDLIQFANDHQIEYRTDSSNLKNEYSRNYFRNKLIPEVEKVFPQAKENVLDTIRHLQVQHEVYTDAIEKQLKKIVEIKGEEWHLPILKLKKLQGMAAYLFEWASRFGFTGRQVPELLRLLDAASGKYMVSGTHRILNNRNWLIVTPLNRHPFSIYTIEENDEELNIPAGKITIRKSVGKPDIQHSEWTANLDARDIEFPLLVRTWKPADYFYPLGMQKKKKLSRFFIDQKISVVDKEKIFVVESKKRILWVIGHRIDNRFKILPSTTNTLILSLTPCDP